MPLAFGRPLEEKGDPMPLRWIALDPQNLPKEMEKVRDGILVEMTRQSFEEKVRRARNADTANTPQFVEARYRAKLEENALVGTGQWKIRHVGKKPSVLRLDSLNLAIKQPRFENREALIGELERFGLGLVVEETGMRTVSLDWTARGEQGPGGLRFKLETPASPVATLELDIPSDLALVEDVGDCQISGPFPAETPMRRLWKVSFSDHPKLFLTIRKVDEPGQPAPLLLVDQMTEQRICPDVVWADYRFNLVVVNQGVRSLQFTCDASLRPYKVVAPKLERWEFNPGPNPDQPGLVTITLSEPLNDGSVRIYCDSPMELALPSQPNESSRFLWKSPSIHLINAIPIGETLKVYLHPAISFEDWHSNAFSLTESKSEISQGRVWPHVLTLKEKGLSAEATAQATTKDMNYRPTGWIPRQRVDFGVHALLWWQEANKPSQLSIRIDYEVVKGSLYHLPISLPDGWDVDRVEVQPPGLLKTWAINKEQGHSVLNAQLNKSLGSDDGSAWQNNAKSTSARLIVSMHRLENSPLAKSGLDGSHPIPFPEIKVPGARWLDGELAIDWDNRVNSGTATSLHAPSHLAPDGPWGDRVPDAYFPYREKVVAGILHLKPNVLQMSARCSSRVMATNSRLGIDATIHLQMQSGVLKEMVVQFSAPVNITSVSTNQGEKRISLHADPYIPKGLLSCLDAIGHRHPIPMASCMAYLFPSTYWKITLPTPIYAPNELEVTYSGDIGQTNSTSIYDAPLITIAGVTRMVGIVTVDADETHIPEIKTRGLTEVDLTKDKPSPLQSTRRVACFEYHSPNAMLQFRGPITSGARALTPSIAYASLTSSVLPNALSHVFHVRLKNWSQDTVSIHMPPSITVTAIRVDGFWLDRIPKLQAHEDSAEMVIGLPRLKQPSHPDEAGDLAHDIEVAYSEDHHIGMLWDRIKGEMPRLPVQADVVRHWWRFPPGMIPLGVPPVLESSPVHEIQDERAFIQDKSKWDEVLEYFSISRYWPGINSTANDRHVGLSSRRGSQALGSGNPESAFTFSNSHYPNDGWTQWQATSPSLGCQEYVVLKEAPLSAAGVLIVGLGGIVALLAMQLGQRLRLAFLLLWIFAFGMGYYWLPGSLVGLTRLPLLAGCMIGLIYYLFAVIRTAYRIRQSRAASRNLVSITIAALVSGLLIIPATKAQPVDSIDNTVLVIPNSKNAAEGSTVLVTPELIKQLDELAAIREMQPRGNLIVAANYEGKVSDQGMECEAEWTVHSFQEEGGLLHLPLSGVQVQEDVLLDGARCLPIVETKPQAGLALIIKGVGKHTVRSRFRVPIQTTGDRRDVEFTAPRPPQSHILLHFPSEANFTQVATRLGMQKSAATATDPTVEAGLGMAAAPIHIRWQQPKDASLPPIVQVRESYLWNVRPATASLTARIDLNAASGTVTQAELVLPDPLEVRTVSVESNSQPGGVLAPRLKTWQVRQSDGQRKLVIVFQNPIHGIVQLILEIVPRNGVSSNVTLPIPTVNGFQITSSSCAYRLENVEGHVKGLAHLTGMKLSDFKENWKSLGGEELFLVGGAYSIARSPDSKPMLHITLQGMGPHQRVIQEIGWRANGNKAEWTAKHTVSSSSNLVLVEWQMPESVILTKVAGRHVWNWSHKGSRLQVWLDKAGSTSEIDMAGWTPLQSADKSEGEKQSVNNPQPQKPLIFDLPTIYPLDCLSQSTTIRIAPKAGFSASTTLVKNLVPIPRIIQPRSEWVYLANKPDYGARIQFQPDKAQINVNSCIVADVHEQRLRIVYTLDVKGLSDQRSTLSLLLHNARHMDIRFEGPTLLRHQEKEVLWGQRMWNIELGPTAARLHRLIVTASIPLARIHGDFLIPKAQFFGQVQNTGWVCVNARHCAMTDSKGLEAVTDDSAYFASWKAQWLKERDKAPIDAALWKINNDNWMLRLAIMPNANISPSLEVSNTEHPVRATEANVSGSSSPPELQFKASAENQKLQGWVFSIVLGIGLTGIWLAFQFPRTLEILARLWPEQLALMGFAGIVYNNSSFLFPAALLLGIASRVVLLSRVFFARIHHRVASIK